MKLQVFSSVVGDDYARYALISIPQFCRCNPDHEYIVFSDHDEIKSLERLFYNLRVVSFTNHYYIFKRLITHTSKIYSAPIHLDDKIHNHAYVSHLFTMMQDFSIADYCLKIDVDTYCSGNICSIAEIYMNSLPDIVFFLVKRQHPLMKKLNVTMDPGVGFCLFRKESNFVDKYIETFEDNEQQTILNLRNSLYYCEIGNESLHCVYPFTHHPNLTKELLDANFAEPKLIHVETLSELKQLEVWYGQHS